MQTNVYNKLATAGHQPKHHILDNKFSRAVQQFLDKKSVTRQNMEAHNHKVNAVEPAVKTEKYHVIATVATLDASFPIQLWSKVILQM